MIWNKTSSASNQKRRKETRNVLPLTHLTCRKKTTSPPHQKALTAHKQTMRERYNELTLPIRCWLFPFQCLPDAVKDTWRSGKEEEVLIREFYMAQWSSSWETQNRDKAMGEEGEKPLLWAASFVLAQAGSRQRALLGEAGEILQWQGEENETKSSKPLVFKHSMKTDRKRILDWIPTGCRGRGKGYECFCCHQKDTRKLNQPATYTHIEGQHTHVKL